MAANRLDLSKSGEPEAAPAEASATDAIASPPSVSGGIKAWLPLIANVLLMPLLAYLTTTFFLLPKSKSESGALAAAAEPSAGSHAASAHGEANSGAKGKFTVPLSNKVLVNVAGTMGTRYLLANLTLVGAQPTVRELVEKNDAELRDVAASVLSSKTIADLEKPGARNLIRTELISVFNHVLGESMVTELYLTEFAIQ